MALTRLTYYISVARPLSRADNIRRFSFLKIIHKLICLFHFKVFWSKDSGSDFPAASERRITHTTFPMGQERRTIVNSFIIRDVKAIDMGVYTCTATNPAGSISWNITLSVLESPRFNFCSIILATLLWGMKRVNFQAGTCSAML